MQTRSKGRVIILSVMILALAVAGCQVFPSYDPFNVRVSVFDSSGQAVSGATVTLRGGTMDESDQTSADGVAVLAGIVPDNYSLAVTYPGGAGVSHALPLWGGEDHEFVVTIDPMDDHLIAAWSFEETEGSRVEDTSGNNRYGEITGNIQRVDGISGQGLHFDGGYVTVKNSGAFNLDAFTVSLWAKVKDPDDDQKLIGRTPIGTGFIIGFQNKGLRPEIWTPGYHDFEEGTIEEDEWTHLVVTFAAGSGMTGYINGERVGHVDIAETMAQNSHDLIMGTNSWGRDNHFFKGVMDEVKIYDRVLSTDEIRSLYEAF